MQTGEQKPGVGAGLGTAALGTGRLAEDVPPAYGWLKNPETAGSSVYTS